MKKEEQAKSSLNVLSIAILQNCRNELYGLFPFLDGAFATLSYMESWKTNSVGTDGASLLFSPAFLVRAYSQNPVVLRRGYLHILLHCLYGHPFLHRPSQNKLWDLACDMAIESIIEREQRKRLQLPQNLIRNECLSALGNQAISAQEIYRLLSKNQLPFTIKEMTEAFLFDDHGVWNDSERNRKKWEELRIYTAKQRLGTTNQLGTRAGTAGETVEIKKSGRYDYRQFLKRFAVFHENLELDQDNYDLIYYCLGMEKYGNLPLIEPLETREGKKLEELVIAIDTSGSCSRETVQKFLEETSKILSEQENFFHKMNVYLLQCDCCIQNVTQIRSVEAWKEYSQKIRIEGRGGTDFTPVFRHVERLRNEGKLKRLKGLLYFTDGDGIYPQTKPDFLTAFVFLKKSAHWDKVPTWALRLLVSQSSMEKEKAI